MYYLTFFVGQIFTGLYYIFKNLDYFLFLNKINDMIRGVGKNTAICYNEEGFSLCHPGGYG